LKQLRKQLLETKSAEEVDDLKRKMHVAEVDLNYAQYSPLSEVYVSLYPPKKDGESEETQQASTRPKPPMWAEVEKCMEEGTLSKLRYRISSAPAKQGKKQENKTRKTQDKKQEKKTERKLEPQLAIDTAGMNRRERRRLLGIAVSKTEKYGSYGVKRTQSYAVAGQIFEKPEAEDAEEDDGVAFFTEG
jgi:hypothetical protein